MIKLLVIGDSDTGKTSMVNLYVHNKFDKMKGPTIVGEFQNKSYLHEGRELKLNIWDIAGQDRLGGVSKLFCRNAAGAIVLCDITRPETLHNAVLWK